jgi:catechol 2,3-dioxygenase-like lactoylglutathione lyase family enzyme
MIARGVHHISFAVNDLDRSLAFYRDLLGLTPAPRPDLGVPGAWLVAGDAQVHLIEVPAGADAASEASPISPLANHQAFAIEDYAATLAALRDRGLEVLETRPEQGQLWIRDPDGNVIELIDPRGRGAGVR